jgi:hypothetical protein
MIISQQVQVVPSRSIAQFAWSNLRRYSNVRFVREKIIDRFELPRNQQANADKQAAQLGFCIAQAKEYFEAADRATLATKPVQLYYGCMSLALGEILWKGDGNVSLDKLRQHHANHGLELKLGNLKPMHGLQISGELGAKANNPQRPTGTFAAWHNIARNSPLIGTVTTRLVDGGTRTGAAIIYGPEDRPMPSINVSGVTFLQCIKSLPAFYYSLRNFNEISDLVRCTLTRTLTVAGERQWNWADTIIVHPHSQSVIEAVSSDFGFRAHYFEKLHCREVSEGFILNLQGERNEPPPPFHLPEGVTLDVRNTYLRPASSVLNEFGCFYVSLYISGMFCRYFPDLWMKHIGEHSEFSLLVEQLCFDAIERLPLLTLSELDQTAYIAPE